VSFKLGFSHSNPIACIASSYLAIAKALQQARQADLALVYYEIALNAKFERAGKDFLRITANDYQQLLQSIVAGEMSSSLKDYADARLESLRRDFPDQPELAVTMFWNTDRTNVDLHVTEPTDEKQTIATINQ
jgi:hypothetical protein